MTPALVLAPKFLQIPLTKLAWRGTWPPAQGAEDSRSLLSAASSSPATAFSAPHGMRHVDRHVALLLAFLASARTQVDRLPRRATCAHTHSTARTYDYVTGGR